MTIPSSGRGGSLLAMSPGSLTAPHRAGAIDSVMMDSSPQSCDEPGATSRPHVLSESVCIHLGKLRAEEENLR